MQCLDLTLPTPEENLALDEALLLEAEGDRSGEVLRFWELPTYAVILGSSCRLRDEIDEARCQADGIPILRRCSGGGTVLLGPGCLAFSLVLSYECAALRDVTHSYAYILERVRLALVKLDPTVARAGSSDLAVRERKISGNCQRRMRSHVLHHGTILHDFNIGRMAKYLRSPQRQPAYRHERSHEDFLTNLRFPVEQIKERLQAAWSADRPLGSWPAEVVRRLVAEKYGQPAWTRRR